MIDCPRCEGSAEVIDSRRTGNSVRRRRSCLSCGHRWSTVEVGLDWLRGLEKLAATKRIEERLTKAEREKVAALLPLFQRMTDE